MKALPLILVTFLLSVAACAQTGESRLARKIVLGSADHPIP
jgi:hypothetical protein